MPDGLAPSRRRDRQERRRPHSFPGRPHEDSKTANLSPQTGQHLLVTPLEKRMAFPQVSRTLCDLSRHGMISYSK